MARVRGREVSWVASLRPHLSNKNARTRKLYHRTNVCGFLRFLIGGPLGLSNHPKVMSNHYLSGVFVTSSYTKGTKFYNSKDFYNKQNAKCNLENRSEPGGNTWVQPAEDIEELWVSGGPVLNSVCAQISSSSNCTSAEVFYPSTRDINNRAKTTLFSWHMIKSNSIVKYNLPRESKDFFFSIG